MDNTMQIPKGYRYDSEMWAVLSDKANKQEERLNAIENEIIDLRGLQAKRKIEDNRSEPKLEARTSELKEVEDKKFQIQIVGELVDEIRRMLKELPKEENNYRRQMLLMFHEALKQNYTKKLFTETQVKALTEVAKICNESFVTREQYFKMDDMLCACSLDMMPDLE